MSPRIDVQRSESERRFGSGCVPDRLAHVQFRFVNLGYFMKYAMRKLNDGVRLEDQTTC